MKTRSILLFFLFTSLSIFVNTLFASVSNTSIRKLEAVTEWKFLSGITTNLPASLSYDDSSWSTITVPHTWNATDAANGGNNYLKTVGWYRKKLAWKNEYVGKKLFIEFLGANAKAECFVNGESLGVHKGGYTAFRFDITNKLTKGDNVIAVKVDNRIDQEIAPLSGDFSFYGGIYREVTLVVVNPVHIDLADHGVSGLYLTTSNVTKESAVLEIRAKVYNESGKNKQINLKAELKHPAAFNAIADITAPVFDVHAMSPGGEPIQTLVETVTIPAGSFYEFRKKITVHKPRLWNGKQDPYRYLVDFSVSEGENIIDNISEYVGFRFFEVTKDGFFLNGNPYPLRGVNRHQDRPEKGNAITEKEHNEDFALMYTMGANSIRLAHYPQAPYIYELCDKYGIVVWAEIPFVDKYGSNLDAFKKVTRQQLVEMIRQQYNRPSILMWGLQNEVSTSSFNEVMSVFVPELHNLAKTEDPSRLTVQAQAGMERYNWTTDLYAKNQYPGWYQNGTFGSYMDRFKPSENFKYFVGMSEYGAGANINQHEIDPARPQHNGQWHPEEYQNKVHENAIIDISSRSWIWGTFVWNMFDFGSDGRNEGNQPGINDKGLVTFDRKVKKDSYFAYKVNWNSEPEVYIASRRFVERRTDTIPVTVYSNCESLELFVNEESQGIKNLTEVECGFFKWTGVVLTKKGRDVEADNIIKAVGKKNGKLYKDEVIWKRILGQSTELYSDYLIVDNVTRTISLLFEFDISEIANYLNGADGSTMEVYLSDGRTPLTSGLVKTGMKLKVTSEDDRKADFYEFISPHHLALKKTATSSSQESGNPVKNSVDGDATTRWAGTSGAAHWMEIDLGKAYFPEQIRIQWYQPDAGRYYRYVISATNDKLTYKTIVDRSSNTQGGIVSDVNLQNKDKYRYIRLNVLSGSGGYPSLYELEVYGWMIESSKYTIDFDKSTITVPQLSGNIEIAEFLSNISFLGNYKVEPKVNSAAYYILDGDKLICTDSNGKEHEFTIRISGNTSNKHVNNQTGLFNIFSDKENVVVSLNEQIDEACWKVFDFSGQLVHNSVVKGTRSVNLSKGLYIFNLSNVLYGSETIKYILK